MKPKKTSIRIDSELWKQFRLKCLEEDLTATKVLTQLIERWLRERRKKKRRRKPKKEVKS